MSRWADTIGADSRVLLIVNSQPSRLDEIEQTIAAIAARTDVSRVSCIAPASLRSWLIQLGLSAANILPARLHGLDVDLLFFLESPRAIRWAVERNATVLLGSEPYAPNNEEVKDAFELRAAGIAWRRVVRRSLPPRRSRVLLRREGTMDSDGAARIHGASSRARAVRHGGVGTRLEGRSPMDARPRQRRVSGPGSLDPNQPAIVDASRSLHDRFSRSARREPRRASGGLRLAASPAGRWPFGKGCPRRSNR